MASTTVSRRAFLGSVAGATTLTALNRRILASQKPNDQIVVGLIGAGTAGMNRIPMFLQYPDVRIGAICDVDSTHVDRAVAAVVKTGGHKPKTFSDFRQLLADREIDAVATITPDHWHAITTVRAFETGKDVYVEKPLSYTVAEGRMIVDASLKYKRVTQMGNLVHASANYRRVVELVQSGTLGRITRVHVWKTSPTRSRPAAVPPFVVPATLDYDFWLGPAPKRPYHPLRSHGSFRYFWDYSGGAFLDFWAHIVDVALWALDLEAPRSVAALGGRFFLKDETETPDTLEVMHDYSSDLLFVFSFRPTPLPGFEHMGEIGCLFEGTEASLVTSYNANEVWVRGKKVDDFPRPAPTIPDSPGHVREFLDAIKTRNLETTCNVRYGHRLTKPGLLSNIAFRTGRRLLWDDKTERFVGDSAADQYLRREFRNDYKL